MKYLLAIEHPGRPRRAVSHYRRSLQSLPYRLHTTLRARVVEVDRSTVRFGSGKVEQLDPCLDRHARLRHRQDRAVCGIAQQRNEFELADAPPAAVDARVHRLIGRWFSDEYLRLLPQRLGV